MRWFFILFFLSSCFQNQPSPQKRRKILRVASFSSGRGIHPIEIKDFYSGVDAARIFEGLFEFNHPGGKPYEMLPLTVKEVLSFDPKELSYTFTLKDNIFFHPDDCLDFEGRFVTSDDVINSIKMKADPHFLDSEWHRFENIIVGLDEWRDQQVKKGSTDYTIKVEGLQKIDDKTFKIKLTKPNIHFLYSLMAPRLNIIPLECLQKKGESFPLSPVGTGAFKVKKIIPQQKYILERFQNTHHAPVKLEGIEVEFFKEPYPSVLKLYRNKIDMILLTKDFFEFFNRDKENNDLIKVVDRMSSSITLLVFNHSLSKIKNVWLRRALSLAIDRNDVVDKLYGGRGVPLEGFFLKDHPKWFSSPYKSSYYQFDLHRAKEALAKAKEELKVEEIEVTLSSPAGANSRQQLEYFQRAWQKIGIKVKTQQFSWPLFIEKKNKGELEIALLGIQSIYPGPLSLWEYLFAISEESLERAPYQYYEKEFSNSLKSLYELAPEKAKDLYRSLALEISDNVYVLGVMQRKDGFAVRKELEGFDFNGVYFGVDKFFSFEE